MSNDSPTERYANAHANVVRLERELAAAVSFRKRAGADLRAVAPEAARRKEDYWRGRGYEFRYCGGCGHRWFERMVPVDQAKIGPCGYCQTECTERFTTEPK